VPALVDAEVGRVFGIPLAPQYSSLSVQKYIASAEAALPSHIRFSCVQSFHDDPLLIQAFAERVREAAPRSDEEVVFTAHSLPARVIDEGDPYENQVSTTADAVAKSCGLAHYQRAWQSAGRTSEPWLDPDLSELIRQRAAAETNAFLVVPVGFVSDHTEILFDIDVQAAAVANDLGVSLRRTASLNTSPTFIRALAHLVERELARK
jgi:protoporphyrin/coproporphyrin ferrochelatase